MQYLQPTGGDAEHIERDLRRIATWRARQARRFPEDRRNLRAAEMLTAMADLIEGVLDESVEEEKPGRILGNIAYMAPYALAREHSEAWDDVRRGVGFWPGEPHRGCPPLYLLEYIAGELEKACVAETYAFAGIGDPEEPLSG